jgi:hypothetical protein
MKHLALIILAVGGLFGFCRWLEQPVFAQKAPAKAAPGRAVKVEPVGEPVAEAAATVVVFNQRDNASPDLAQYYAGKRGIPKDHVVAVSCPPEEEISRADY